MPTVAAALHLLLLLSFTLRPLSSTSTPHPRRILHQPLLPLDSTPPSPPPPPSFPFTASAPGNSPFFQSYPSPPPPPSPASFATFPANISSLTVPSTGPSKPKSTSSKLIIAAIATVVAAITVVALSVFLHIRHRTASRRPSSFNQSKPPSSENSSAISFNQAPHSRNIPKLHRPSQSSSEFLYLGTLVNAHAPGGDAATTSNLINAANSRKLDSPELHPLPPLITHQRDFGNNADVISSRDDESEVFYSPKGSINGRESSIGTGSASRRTFAAVELENFNGSTSNSSSTHSSTSVLGSGSPAHSASFSLSPANNRSPINSMPKSPDLIDIQTIAPLPPQMSSHPEATGSQLQKSASPSPPSLSSPDRNWRRSEEISPRNSSDLDQNLESLTLITATVLHSTTANLAPPATRGLEVSACLPPSLQTVSSPGSSPKNSNASGRDVESSSRSSSAIEHKPHNINDIPTSPELRGPELQGFPLQLPLSPSSRSSNVSDLNLESSLSDSIALEHTIPNPPEIRGPVPDSAPPLAPDSSLPRKSNVSGQLAENSTVIAPLPETQGFVQPNSSFPSFPNSDVWGLNVESPVRSNSPTQQNAIGIPTGPEIQPESTSPLSPERLRTSEESSARNSNGPDVKSPGGISSPEHHNPTVNSSVITEMEALVLQEPASPLATSNDESSPRNSNVSDENVKSPVRICSQIPASPELEALALPDSPAPMALEIYSVKNEETSPRNSNASDQDVESSISSPVQSFTVVWSYPTQREMQDLDLSSPERHSIRSEESSPRISNVSDHCLASPVRISNPKVLELPSLSSPERLGRKSEESSSRTSIDFDPSREPPSSNDSALQDNAIAISTPPPPVSVPPQPPPPPPPPPLGKAWISPRTPTPPLGKAWISPRTPTPPTKNLVQPHALINPFSLDSPALISPKQLPSEESQTIKESPGKETDNSGESLSPPKPKLKPLHWDKVRASSDREMVWDQLKCSSFKLNEEMIETLFLVNTPKPSPNEATRWQVLPSPGLDNGDKVLDPKKAQNIAILLKALHVTVDEVCEGLLEGNADILGTELLESLLKMAPTKEEERKLKECRDDSLMKLGAAERFLKAVVDIPHAFKRVEALLYVSNFESEVDYLKKSFATLEAACEELRTSRMFLKLLEAVLKTGNRMNVGTNRGDAHAFKLDTLLKLVDVKGADGKTTLLHFVVQEMIRSEGARLSGEHAVEESDAKCRRLGLEVVSALSLELSNVKKAAVMEAEALSTEVSKLARGIVNVKEIIELIGEASSSKFAESMMEFTQKAEEENFRIQAQERLALSLVKEITEYFHGNSAMEEAHPLRIFMVVREFLTVLDGVCKDVRMINERTVVSSAHKFPVPVNPMMMMMQGRRQQSSSDD